MVFESLLALSRPLVATLDRSDRARSFGFTVDAPATGLVYGEETFRHFLAVERRRAERSNRSFLMLLVSLRACPKNGTSHLSGALSRAVFAGLDECMRDVDFRGWYRDKRVAAVVMPQQSHGPASEVRARIAERARVALGEQLPGAVAERLKIRVVRLQAAAR